MTTEETASAVGNWADSLAKQCLFYFGVCGLSALALDLLSAWRSGHFTVASPESMPVMLWACFAGFIASAVAYIGYPSRRFWRIIAMLLPIVYACSTVVVWLTLYYIEP